MEPLRIGADPPLLATTGADAVALLAADRETPAADPLRIAVAAETSVDLLALPAVPVPGGVTHRLRIRSPGARTVGVALAPFRVPAGVTLRSRNEAGALGPFDARDASGPGELWPPPLTGEELTLELFVPHAAAFAPEVVLARVHHGYREAGAAVAGARAADACHVDAGCSDEPQLDGPIRSVALYTIQGTHVCTGQLVDSATPAPIPYLLTADHCGVTSTNAHTVRVYWNVVSPACGLRCCGDRSLSQSGATVRARHAATDMCLLELREPPPAGAHAYASGWDARESTRPASATAIHHPEGGEKAISVNVDPLVPSGYLIETGGDGSHWCVDGWESGSTAPGSSGSGLWDEHGRLVGQLHGGYAACGNVEPDWYGRLARAWTGGGSASTRLSDWLDPNGITGRVRDGRELGPGAPATPVAAATPRPGWLLAPVPNPLRDAARVRWILDVAGVVEIDVFDVAGRHVRSLANGPAEAGAHAVTWTGTRATGRRAEPGTYLVRLRHDGRTVSGTKLIVGR